MGLFTRRERTESGLTTIYGQLDSIREALRKLNERVDGLEGEEFKLAELRRQARNAVRSLERAAANVAPQDAPGRTNGAKGRVGYPSLVPDPPGPRRNY